MTRDEYLRREECPFCGAPVRAARPAVGSSPPGEALAFGEHGMFVSGYTARRVFFTYYRCGECCGLYCPVYFSQEQLNRLYSRQQENMTDVPLAAREATQREYLELLARYARFEGDYLELGPDIGIFAGMCAARGNFSRFYLYEPNLQVHPQLVARMRGKPVSIEVKPYGLGRLKHARVRLAAAIHVLDHLIHPAQLLAVLYEDLEPGGVLFLVTHNEASLLARVLGRRWPPYTLQHPQLFSPESLTRLLETCGFRVLGIERTKNYFPVTHLVRAAFSVLGLERIAPAYDHPFSVGLRLGNMAAIARRPA